MVSENRVVFELYVYTWSSDWHLRNRVYIGSSALLSSSDLEASILDYSESIDHSLVYATVRLSMAIPLRYPVSEQNATEHDIQLRTMIWVSC